MGEKEPGVVRPKRLAPSLGGLKAPLSFAAGRGLT
jgi:hypothetical protein